MFVRAQAQGLHVTHSLHCQAVTITRSHNDTSEQFSIPLRRPWEERKIRSRSSRAPTRGFTIFLVAPTKLTFSPDVPTRSEETTEAESACASQLQRQYPIGAPSKILPQRTAWGEVQVGIM
jgi:hypothetical protein